MHYIVITESSLDFISRDVTEWFLGKFLSDFDLDLSIIPMSLENEVLGWTLQLDIDEYEIEIEKNLTQLEYITTLLHELVHVWQYTQDYQCEDEAYHMESQLTQQYVAEKNLALVC